MLQAEAQMLQIGFKCLWSMIFLSLQIVLTMPTPSPWYDNPHFVQGLVCISCRHVVLAFQQVWISSLSSFSEGRKRVVYRAGPAKELLWHP